MVPRRRFLFSSALFLDICHGFDIIDKGFDLIVFDEILWFLKRFLKNASLVYIRCGEIIGNLRQNLQHRIMQNIHLVAIKRTPEAEHLDMFQHIGRKNFKQPFLDFFRVSGLSGIFDTDCKDNQMLIHELRKVFGNQGNTVDVSSINSAAQNNRIVLRKLFLIELADIKAIRSQGIRDPFGILLGSAIFGLINHNYGHHFTTFPLTIHSI